MLRYIELNEFVTAMPDIQQAYLTRDTAGNVTINNDNLKAAAVQAEQTFESYAGRRYALPVKTADNETPEAVRRFIYVVLKYILFARRNKITAETKEEHDAQLAWIRDVVAYRADIPRVSESGAVQDDSIDIETGGGYSPKFNRFV